MAHVGSSVILFFSYLHAAGWYKAIRRGDYSNMIAWEAAKPDGRRWDLFRHGEDFPGMGHSLN